MNPLEQMLAEIGHERDALRARVAELERVLQEIVEVDPETQIGGVSSYLYAWEQCHTIARTALGEKDNGNV